MDNALLTLSDKPLIFNSEKHGKTKKSSGYNISGWYTVDELAMLTGFSLKTLKHGENNINVIMSKMSVNIEVNTRLGGYHNTTKYYSENVLKALKEYQITNGVSNATKNKEVAISGNISVIQKDTFEKTINGLLDNPEALMTLVAESSKRVAMLAAERDSYKNCLEDMTSAKGYYSLGSVAKILNFKPHEFNRLLIQIGFCIANSEHEIKQEMSNRGYGKFVIPKNPSPDGKLHGSTKISPKGIVWIAKKLKVEPNADLLNTLVEKN